MRAITAALISAAVLVPTVYAGPRGGTMAVGRVVHDPVLADKIGLSSDELQALQQAYFQHRKKVATLRGQIGVAQVELEEAKLQDPVDETAINAILDRIGELRTSLSKERVRFELKVKKLLGPDRLQRLKNEIRLKCGRQAHGRGRHWQGGWQGGRTMPPGLPGEEPVPVIPEVAE